MNTDLSKQIAQELTKMEKLPKLETNLSMSATITLAMIEAGFPLQGDSP